MIRSNRLLNRYALALVAVMIALTATAWAQSNQLSEDDITTLINLGIDEETIVARIQKGGLSFAADDDAVLERLKTAGASEAVVKAVKSAKKAKKEEPSKKPAPAPGVAPITYEDVLKLLQLKLDESVIVKRLEKSPTIFTLDANQVAELKQAGASDELIAALSGKRPKADQQGDVTDFAILLDCSGSMLERTTDGKTKMEIAKTVVADLVEKIPDGLRLTFVLYGHNKQQACKAVQIVRPLAELDAPGKEELKKLIGRLKPAGATPIALALETAGKELLKNDAYSGMVLISDGKESCMGDPAAEAAKLAMNPKLSFGINVIGFDVKAEERESLEGIAKSGNGKYYNAESAAELEASVSALRKELESKTKSPEQRGSKDLALSGKAGKPGAFLHDAGPVEAGEYKGTLAMLEAHYYKIALQKGQELRVIGQIQKSPYNGSNNTNNQTFTITLYDPGLAVVKRDGITVKENPKSVQTLRSAWTATSSGVFYIGIAATDNHNERFIPNSTYPDNEKPKPSPYALRIRVEGAAEGASEAVGETPVVEVNGGNGFDQAGEIPLPGLTAGDLKIGEVTFFKTKVSKGQTLTATVAMQKPWHYGSNEDIESTYVLTVYDDDQVQIANKAIKISKNPPDANSFSLSWPVTLDGHAYVSVSCENTGGSIYPKEFEPKPGRIAVRITEADEGAANP
ncbi:MAG: VWA domain-containing protein [Pirellulales bacterium]